MRLESFLNSLFEVLVVVILENFKALDNWIKFSDESSMFSGTQLGPTFIYIGGELNNRFHIFREGARNKKKTVQQYFCIKPICRAEILFRVCNWSITNIYPSILS